MITIGLINVVVKKMNNFAEIPSKSQLVFGTNCSNYLICYILELKNCIKNFCKTIINYPGYEIANSNYGPC